MIGEPLDEPVHERDLLGLRTFPALEPAAHLAVQKSVGFSKRDQSVLFNIDGVQLNQAVDESSAHSRRIIGKDREFVRNTIADDDPSPALHDEEDCADDRCVLAKVKDL